MVDGIKVILRSKEQWISSLKNFNSSLFIHPDWLESLTDEKHAAFYIDLEQNQKIVGKISGISIAKPNLHTKEYYCFCSPALIEENQILLNSCLEELLQFARKNKISRLLIGSYDHNYSLPIKLKHFYSTQRDEFNVNVLTHTSQRYSKRFKNNLKKTKKFNCEYLSVDNTYLPQLISLLSSSKSERINKKRKDYNPMFMPYLNEKSLQTLVNKDMASFKVVKVENEVHCIGLCLSNNISSSLLFLGISPFGYKNGLSAFLFHSIISELKEKNIEKLNLGGIPEGTDGNNLSIFKLSMGAQQETFYGATTNYLTFPLKLLNPLLIIGRKLKGIPFIYRLKDKLL